MWSAPEVPSLEALFLATQDPQTQTWILESPLLHVSSFRELLLALLRILDLFAEVVNRIWHLFNFWNRLLGRPAVLLPAAP